MQTNVRRSIESHLLDSSPAVRDAAVELIGKYMIDSPEFAGDYYHKIAERIAVGIYSSNAISSLIPHRILVWGSVNELSSFSSLSTLSLKIGSGVWTSVLD